MTAQRIIVLGAGVIGITNAYKLAMDGHDVTVIDAEDGAAMMTSCANVGHGHMGWTMASGCAAITADIIVGRTLNHDIRGLAYGHG